MTFFHNKISTICKASLLSIAFGTISLFSIQVAATQTGNSMPDGEHGDDPVIGSLPIKEIPQLEQLFPATSVRFEIPVLPNVPVFGLVADSDISQDILSAAGTPFGWVNSFADRNILGISRDAVLVVQRSGLASGKIEGRYWLPDEFIGGYIKIDTNSGIHLLPINDNHIELPIPAIVDQPGFMVYANITISPNPNSNVNPVELLMSIAGSMVTIVYEAQ
ncbi:MAG: hypothetical protein QGF46_06200 [Planctomycetota bacterium]|jgi:hypothetical protein|nr:hypothetical protein [Planctomycetota bacterium]